MSITQAEVIKRSCTDKLRYATEMTARMSATRRLFFARSHKRKGQKVGRRMWVYPCEFCSGWHLTSRLSGHGEAVEI